MKRGVTKLAAKGLSRLFFCDLGHIVGQFTLFFSPLSGAASIRTRSVSPAEAALPALSGAADDALFFWMSTIHNRFGK